MKDWLIKFLNSHGEREIFALQALAIAAALWLIGLEEQAQTIIIGVGMLFYNKARSYDKTDK